MKRPAMLLAEGEYADWRGPLRVTDAFARVGHTEGDLTDSRRLAAPAHSRKEWVRMTGVRTKVDCIAISGIL